jgi:hypothetical protein
MITNSHVLPFPLRVPSRSQCFENRHWINYIAIVMLMHNHPAANRLPRKSANWF